MTAPGPRLDNQALHQSYFDPSPYAGVDITRGVMTAWLRMHLRSDEEAARMFDGDNCVICADDRWTIRSK